MKDQDQAFTESWDMEIELSQGWCDFHCNGICGRRDLVVVVRLGPVGYIGVEPSNGGAWR